MPDKRILCFGAGGHASVVVELIGARSSSEAVEVVGLVGLPNETGKVLGVPILGSEAQLPRIIAESGATHFVVAVGTLRGGLELRPKLFRSAESAGLSPFTAIHPSAVISPSAVIEAGATIMAGCVVQARTRIGRNAIINTRASVDHDCVVGEHAHLAPGSVCSGGVTIGGGAHIGTGAIILQDVRIGKDATVGAGATVTHDCEAGVIVVGTPAQPIPSRHSSAQHEMFKGPDF